MPLSSSYHDYGDYYGNGSRQRSVPTTSSVAPTRSPVQLVGRDSSSVRYGQRQASPESTGNVAVVALGTATLALHRDREASQQLSVSLPPPLPDSRPVVMSPRRQQTAPSAQPREPSQQRQPAGTAVDGRASVTSSRPPRRSAQPLPSNLNPTFQASVSHARPSELRSAAPSTSLARDTAAGLPAPPALSFATGPATSTSPRLAHLRPLNTSREADYLNLAYQRGFLGRFRCATSVVVRTPAAATPHTHVMGTTDGPAAGNAEAPPQPAQQNTTAEIDGGYGEVPQVAVPADGHDAPAADPHERRPHTGPLGGTATMLSRPRLSHAVSGAASVVSGSTTRRGRTGGRASGRPALPSASASVTASSLPRRSLRSTPTSTGLRRGGTTTDGAGASAAALRGAEVPAGNMAALTHTGLHTSLWMAVQDGGIEVRSAANPTKVLASLPRKDARTVVTSLVEICGNCVVAGHTDGSLHLFDAATLKAMGEHQPHTAAVTKLLYIDAAPPLPAEGGATVGHATRTSSLLLTASLDRTMTVWAAATMTLLHRLKGNVRGVCAVAATSTGGFAFSGSDEGTIRMWDVVRGQQWGVTKDERAQLGRRSREETPVAGRVSQRDFKAYTESSSGSSSGSNDDESDESSTDDNGHHGRSFSPAHASPHLRAASPQQLSHLHHVRPPAATGGSTGSTPSHRRSLVGYGGVKVVPRTTTTLSRGTLTLQQTGLQVRHRGNTAVAASSSADNSHRLHHAASQPSSRSLPATEDAFAPTDTATSSTPFRDGDGVLAGLGGGISPLRGAALNDDGAAEAEVANALDYGYDVPVPTRTHRVTSAKKKKLRTAGAASGDDASGVRGKRLGKGSKAAGGGKRKKTKKAKKAPASPTATAAATMTTRAPSSVVGQRLEGWFRLYQQRVLLSAASQQLTARFTAGYDAASAMNWPIECAHIEYITALTVVEDRLLISASCDATAKVFALPSGQYIRTLTSSRRMPLAGVLYDSSVGRLYTGFSDGAVSVYDLTSPELPLVSQLQSPHTVLSCSFASLVTAPMQRFVLNARLEGTTAEQTAANADASSDTAVVTTVAQFDKTTLAHGPNQTTSSYRVGQPSLRELNAAVSLQSLQQQRVATLLALTQRSSGGTLEAKELRGKRQCGLVLAQTHRRRQAERVFLRWQRWAERRAVLRQFARLADARARHAECQLLGRYVQRWANVTREHAKVAAGQVLRAVQLQGSDATLLAVPAAVRARLQSSQEKMAAAMAASLAQLMLRRVYRRWRDFQCSRHAELQQALGFNTLLLSMNASADAPSCHTLTRLTRTAARRGNQANALWLLTELTARWQSQRQRRHFFDRWRAFARARHRQQIGLERDAWRLVEPLSSTLVQQQAVRRRYFEVWRSFALFVARSGQLTNERETLQREWATLQRVLATPATVAELKARMRAAETATAQAAGERAALAERVQMLADEDSTLRTEEALRVLIAGYYVPDAAATAEAAPTHTLTAAPTTPRSVHGGVTRSALNTRRTSVASSVDSGGVGRSRLKSLPSGAASSVGNAEDVDDTEEMQQQQRQRKLLVEASAVLRALKGNCMQYARDDKLLAKAHALALRLPIVEPLLSDAPASAESTPSRRSGLAQPPPRHTTWSVSSAKNGASTAVAAVPSPVSASAASQRRRCSTLSGAVSSTGSALNTAGAGTPTANASGGSTVTTPRTSVAQMWAAQPAEENYASLADAFNAVYANLLSLLYAAARECGVSANATSRSASTTAESRGRPPGNEVRPGKETAATAEDDSVASEGLQAPAVAPSWLAQVPLKQRRTMVGEVLKLVTLFDSFASHSDLPVERAGSISTRGAANTRALPLCSLCSTETADSLLRHAAVLLELVDPLLWPRQLKLNYLQDAYAAAIAELNATVSSSHVSDGRPHSSTVMTRSESDGRDASPLPAPLVMKPPALCLSAEVLQRAADALPPSSQMAADPHSSPATTSGSDGPSTRQGLPKALTTTATAVAPAAGLSNSSSSYHPNPNGPPHPTLLLSNLDSHVAPRSYGGSEEKLNGTLKSIEEEGQTPTPDPHHARSASFSHRTFSAVSTPRSYTPRTAASSVAGTSTALTKPYLGFRVNVTRGSTTARRAATTISIRDVAVQYVNADGLEVDGPALTAGLQAGDQLVRFAGYAVTDLAAFNAVVSRHVHGGAELPVVVQRGEELLSTTIIVGARAA